MEKYYRVQTQEAYNDLMKVMEEKGYRWSSDRKPTRFNAWEEYEEKTVICVFGSKKLAYGNIKYREYDGITNFIEWTVEPKKIVEVSREFDEWVQKAKTAYGSGELWKEWCIWQINKMGFSHWLEEPITRKRIQEDFCSHPEWTKEVARDKELHTRAILDGYTVKKEKLYEIPLPEALNTAKNQQYLSYDKKANHFVCAAKTDTLMQQFTELAIENMVPKFYHELAVEVGED
ncbi:TPA: DUF1642 domain-containing protein [Enterococcus faecalis]|nr:DUF1642 domain-containing protein [Enterococcus faecalis]HBI1739395.1 DUF1642 domain-containing protein [Enterococcus faecalis]HBI1742254.1 DUF1642 domain-containing protein [Enterococcus faecalis]HBI1745592.1 DUF1642 domain-containing protein [Enterococcus faecalis]HBI1747997.1 DUF1642 domain-containing protein [Enterococcus faecalis]